MAKKKTSSRKPPKSKKYSSKRRLPFNVNRRKKVDTSDIPKVKTLIADTLEFIGENFKVMAGITVLYAIVYLLLIRTNVGFNLQDIQNLIVQNVGDKAGDVFLTSTLLGITLGQVVSASELTSIYGAGVLTLFSLMFIYAIRHISANKDIKIRDAVYNGPRPLVPFLMISMLIAVELIPFGAAAGLFGVVKSNGLSVTFFEDLTFILILVSGAAISMYFLTTSIMALYASTYPNVYPYQAFKTIGHLIHKRRSVVFRRIVGLPIILGIVYLIILVTVIRVVPNYAFWCVDLFAIITMPILHVYNYKLYRSLL